MMRSFDQFANLVLEDTFERRIVASSSGEETTKKAFVRLDGCVAPSVSSQGVPHTATCLLAFTLSVGTL